MLMINHKLLILSSWLISVSAFLHGQYIFEVYDQSGTGLTYNSVHTLNVSPDGKIWIGTEWGLNVFDPASDQWMAYFTSNSALADNSIRSIAFDTSGNAWIGTFSGGLAMLSDTGWAVFNTQNSPLPDDYIRCLAVDDSNHLWIGTSGGLVRFDGSSWRIWQMFTSPLLSNNISALAPAPDGSLWIGTINGGLVIRRDTGMTVFALADGFPDNTVLSIAFDTAGLGWLATPQGGLVVMHNQTWQVFNTVNSPIPSNSLTGVAFHTKWGVMATSVDSGLINYTGGLTWNLWSTRNAPLPENHLTAIAVDDSSVWVATANSGIVRMYAKPVAIPQVYAAELTVALNPEAHAIIFSSPGNRVESVTLYDLNGNVLKGQRFQTYHGKIDYGDLPAALYIFQVRFYDSMAVRKIFVRN